MKTAKKETKEVREVVLPEEIEKQLNGMLKSGKDLDALAVDYEAKQRERFEKRLSDLGYVE